MTGIDRVDPYQLNAWMDAGQKHADLREHEQYLDAQRSKERLDAAGSAGDLMDVLAATIEMRTNRQGKSNDNPAAVIQSDQPQKKAIPDQEPEKSKAETPDEKAVEKKLSNLNLENTLILTT